MLLRRNDITESEDLLRFFVKVLDNISMHLFYKNVNHIVEKSGDGEKISLARISESAAHLLVDLLQSDYVRDVLPLVSKVIMRLSIEDCNLLVFIAYLEQLVRRLTGQTLAELGTEEKLKSEGSTKLMNLMYIFYEMVKAFDTYPTSPEKHSQVLGALRKIV